jgi:hypothetical protein
MSTTIPSLLSDTLQMVTLARETALVLGKENQAKKLTPVVEELRSVVSTAKNPSPLTDSSGVMEQSDFQTLLSAAQNTTPSDRTIPSLGISERNMIVKAMAEGSMPDVDIARQLGMTRDEVNLVLNIGKASSANMEVK